MAFVEENEISVNSFGGTEITKRSIGKNIPEELAQEFQIIPSRVRDLKEDKIRVYWAHDLSQDPECSKFKDENYRNKFHKFVFSSNWQMNEYAWNINFPLDSKIQVIETPVEPIEFVEKPKDKINLIYFSTPQRGLDILLPVFETLTQKFGNIHLDVFSSFKIYGWEEADKQFQPLYDKINQHPNMTYHGFAKQEVLLEHLQKAHILAYPSNWIETSCRVLIESMSAGLLCVHPNLGALSDTSGGQTFMYQYDHEKSKHAEVFYKYLHRAVETVQQEDIQRYLRFVKAYADTRFNLEKISTQWETLMNELKDKYPTVDSRKFAEEMFVYKTS